MPKWKATGDTVKEKMVEACKMIIGVRNIADRILMNDFVKRNISGAAAQAEAALKASDIELEQAKSCICPCGAENPLDLEDFNLTEKGEIHQLVVCSNCDKSSYLVFTLTDVRELAPLA